MCVTDRRHWLAVVANFSPKPNNQTIVYEIVNPSVLQQEIVFFYVPVASNLLCGVTSRSHETHPHPDPARYLGALCKRVADGSHRNCRRAVKQTTTHTVITEEKQRRNQTLWHTSYSFRFLEARERTHSVFRAPVMASMLIRHEVSA